jgi:hypothetical protein
MSQRPADQTGEMDSTDLVGAADVLAAAGCMTRALAPAAGRTWSAKVPHLSWTVAETVAHAARATLWCAVDLAAGGIDLRSVLINVDGEAGPDQLLPTITAAGQLVGYVVSAVPADTRGYDPDGPADRSGFAAMCGDELLVHGWDAGQGLGVEVEPDAQLAARVLGRLFPWVTPEPNPWSALLWANGRIALPGKPKLERWKWHVAPLAEWNGRPVSP